MRGRFFEFLDRALLVLDAPRGEAVPGAAAEAVPGEA